MMRPGRPLVWLVASVVVLVLAGVLASPPPVRSQSDIFVNVLATGAKKLNIVIPNFAVVAGTDTAGLGRSVPQVTARDLTFSALFSVVSDVPPIPTADPAAVRASFANFAAAGAHAGLQGLLSLRGDRTEVEMRLYDLTSPEFRLIATKKIELPANQPRRLSHKIADEVVMQFTGEAGIADTKIAYVNTGRGGAKEVSLMDYDGAGAAPRDVEQVDQPLADLEPGRPLPGLHVVHAGLPVPLPDVPVREPPGAGAGRLPRHQQLARLQPGRQVGSFDPLPRRQPRGVRAEPRRRAPSAGSPPTAASTPSPPGLPPGGRSPSCPSGRAGRTSS